MPLRSRPALLLCVALALASPVRAEVRVEVHGLSGPERENVETRLGIATVTGVKLDDDALVRRLHREAESDIRTALQAFGYYRPRIEADLVPKGGDWRAIYRIDPGEPTRIMRIDLQLTGGGAEDPELLKVIEDAPLRRGARLLHADYEETKRRLARAAYRNGFLDATFEQRELVVNPDAATAEIYLTLNTGPQFYIGPVTVEQGELDEDFLRRYISLEPGQPFDPERLLQTQFTLTDLQYFGSVDVEARRDEAVDHRIPVYIRMTSRPPRRYDVGVGYGTDTGPRLSLGTEFRRINRRGHRLRTDLRISELENSLGSEYAIPLGNRPGESLSATAAARQQEIGDGESRKYQVGLALTRQPGDWQRQLYINYEHEESELPDVRRESDLLIPGASLSRMKADHPLYARSGWFAFLDVHGTHPVLLSNTSFLQTRLLVRGALPFGARGRVLGRVESGASFVDEFSELPASQRFFAGGDQSVRGYAYQSLGPRDQNGEVIGGEYLLTMSVEAEYLVWRNWGAAVFYDAGNAYDDPRTDLFRGAGIGARWRSPIGVLQLDLARPLDDPDRNVRIHLGVVIGL